MSIVENDSAFKIYSAVKCPGGKSLLSMKDLFAENRFTVSTADFKHCLSRAEEIGLVKLMSSGKYRWTKKICDAHIRGLFRKFLDEKQSQTMCISKVESGTLSKSRMTKKNYMRYREVQPVSWSKSKSYEAVPGEQNGGSSNNGTRLIEAMNQIRGMSGDSHSSNKNTTTLRINIIENRVAIRTRDVDDHGRGSESLISSNEDLLKDRWNEINSVLEAVTDEEFVNLRFLRAQI